MNELLSQCVREREDLNGKHQAACLEIERLNEKLKKKYMGHEARRKVYRLNQRIKKLERGLAAIIEINPNDPDSCAAVMEHAHRALNND